MTKTTYWYWYDENGTKHGTVTGGQLKGLARQGIITPETIVETEGGKQAKAKKVSGLFKTETQPTSGTPADIVPTESSSIVLPPSATSNPFTAVPVPSLAPPTVADETKKVNSQTLIRKPFIVAAICCVSLLLFLFAIAGLVTVLAPSREEASREAGNPPPLDSRTPPELNDFREAMLEQHGTTFRQLSEPARWLLFNGWTKTTRDVYRTALSFHEIECLLEKKKESTWLPRKLYRANSNRMVERYSTRTPSKF